MGGGWRVIDLFDIEQTTIQMQDLDWAPADSQLTNALLHDGSYEELSLKKNNQELPNLVDIQRSVAQSAR